jgi:gas vesicle protein
MAKDEIGPGGILVAFVAGALVGAAVALLYAPQSGEDTRDLLGRRAREEGERARRNITTAFDKAREQYDKAREQYQSASREPEPEA